jgi:hypothetical protein
MYHMWYPLNKTKLKFKTKNTHIYLGTSKQIPIPKLRIDGTIKKRNDKNGCYNIYVPNDKNFDPRKIQKIIGYTRKNSIQKSQPVPGTFEDWCIQNRVLKF